MREVTSGDAVTSFVCGQGGKRVLRKTRDLKSGKVERVMMLAGLAEIRPDDSTNGILLNRMSVAKSTVFEDARDLKTGLRVVEKSGYLHKDVRGSVLATSSLDASKPAEFTSGVDYDPWGNQIAVSGFKAATHAFIDHEPDPGLGYYHFGARVYDPSLRRWLSPDPLLLALPHLDETDGTQLNLYAYAGNNPVGQIDSNGQYAIAKRQQQKWLYWRRLYVPLRVLQ